MATACRVLLQNQSPGDPLASLVALSDYMGTPPLDVARGCRPYWQYLGSPWAIAGSSVGGGRSSFDWRYCGLGLAGPWMLESDGGEGQMGVAFHLTREEMNQECRNMWNAT